MVYFEIKIQPDRDASSDVILIDRFHPRWKEGAKKLLEGRIVTLMQDYTGRISRWAETPIDLDFSEHGLNRISLPQRGGLNLFPQEEEYRSHNINSPRDVAAVVAVMSHYIGWLNSVIRDLH